jgi:glycosyltransferase involved in cell wall biosynthesis
MSPLVSILSPTYNHAACIAECLESVLGQSFQDWEQLVLDDGSTDETQKVVARFSDPRIRYLRCEHRGLGRLAETYNFGLAQARGSLIALLEGDDTWHPEMLETQVPRLQDGGVALAFADIDVNVAGAIQASRRPIRRWRASWSANDPEGSSLEPLLSFQGMPQPATWLVRRSALEAVGGFCQPQGIATTDYPTLLRLCLKGRFAYTPRVLACWRKHRGQATDLHAGEVFIACADFAEHFYRKEVPEQVKARFLLGEPALSRAISRQRAFGHFRQGRCELLSRAWPRARRSFLRAFGGGSAYVKLASACGWFAGLAHRDLEAAARRLGKEWYETR